jgi:hypothetical protein
MLKSFKGLHFTILNIIALPLVGYSLIRLVLLFSMIYNRPLIFG